MNSGKCTVIAFDPGETTGFAAMWVRQEVLFGGSDLASEADWEHGQIDCRNAGGMSAAEASIRQHAGLNMEAENLGVLKMMRLVENYDFENPVIVVEDFVLDPNKATMGRDLLTPVRLMAALHFGLWCDENKYNEHKFFVQNRAPVKTTCTDNRLKEWGFYDRNSGPHARDAMRHAYYFLRTCHGNDAKAKEKRALAWPHLFSYTPPAKPPKRDNGPGERIYL